MPGSPIDRQSPIFLAGPDRSGIGLLGEILECHPALSITRRTNFWDYYDGRFGDLRDPLNVDRCLDAVMRDRRGRLFDPDRRDVLDHLSRYGASYEHLFEALQVQLMVRRGATRWGDKSLGSERHAGRILSAYPSARMIHVLRDPRDRFASHKHHRGAPRGGAGSGAALWRWSEQLAISNRERFGDRYRVVRYEDLVTEPETTLGHLCRFLELEPVDTTPAPAWSVPLTPASIGRYRRDLSASETRFIELATAAGMQRWGYTRGDDAQAPPALEFWVLAAPVQALSGLGWRLGRAVGRDRSGHPSRRSRPHPGPDRRAGTGR